MAAPDTKAIGAAYEFPYPVNSLGDGSQWDGYLMAWGSYSSPTHGKPKFFAIPVMHGRCFGFAPSYRPGR